MKYKCPCCEFYTFDEKPHSTYEICEICGWEDDADQFQNPDARCGANKLSLNEARRHYRIYKTCEENTNFKGRKPFDEEYNGIDWY